MSLHKLQQAEKVDMSIVLPCLNEAPALALVYQRLLFLKKTFPGSLEIIFVDDGSRDETSQILSSFDQATSLKHDLQKGYGAALKYGFAQARGEHILFLDADGTYDPMDCLEMYEQIKAQDLDMIFGTRLLQRGDMSWLRWSGNQLFVVLIKTLFRKKITDSCTGFRLFHRRCLRPILSIHSPHFSFSIIMSLKMLAGPFKVSEVEISYGQRLGVSKLNWIRDGITHVYAILNFFIRSRILKQNAD